MFGAFDLVFLWSLDVGAWSFSSRRFEPVKAAAVGQWENDLIVGGLRLQVRDKRWRIRNRRPIGRA